MRHCERNSKEKRLLSKGKTKHGLSLRIQCLYLPRHYESKYVYDNGHKDYGDKVRKETKQLC